MRKNKTLGLSTENGSANDKKEVNAPYNDYGNKAYSDNLKTTSISPTRTLRLYFGHHIRC